MQQVAERAGVSRTTVSFVLNNTPNVNISAETRARIWQAAQELNYARDFAALSLATGRSHTIAFVLRQHADELLVDAFLGGVLNGIANAINPVGYHLLFCTLDPNAPGSSYSELIRSQRVDGLLISGPVINETELHELHEEGVPIVMQGTPDIDTIYSVDVDNVASAKQAVDHLLELGHTCIAHITPGPLGYIASRDRLTGYRQALDTAGIDYDEELVAEGNFTYASGYTAMKRLLNKSNLPTAVFIANDVVALGAIRAIREAGLSIPTDMSVIGFDDVPTAGYVYPGLTTIHLPTVSLGKCAGEMLLALINGQEPAQQRILLETQLVIRGSTSEITYLDL
jgi:DNA-binding LacI/PurR family transcriptional regulator